MPDTTSEVQRLKRVYQHYHTDQATQEQWSLANRGNQAILEERLRQTRRLLQAHGFWPLPQRPVLEVGCGSGGVLATLQQLGADPRTLHGVDLLPERIAAARQNHPEMHFTCANAERLEFDDHSFRLVLVFTVFSSILDAAMAANVAREIDRVLTPGGAVLLYDFRYDNPRNPHVRGVTRETIANLFPAYRHRLHTVTLLPPLARRLGHITTVLYPLLGALPPLRTHYLGLLLKPEADH